MTKSDVLLSNVIQHYHKREFSEAVNGCKAVLPRMNDDNSTLLSVDLGHLLCLSGNYVESVQVLSGLVDRLETQDYPFSVLANAYLSYAISLLNLDEFGKYCFYISKYMHLIKESNPEEYDYLMQEA